MDKRLEPVKKSAEFISQKIGTDKVDVGIILGTGLSGFAESLQGEEFPYSEIPEFPQPTVKGHAGKLTYTVIADKKTLCFQGRLHYYEGYPIDKVVFPIRVMKELGVKTLIITNSSGSLTKELKPGDIMIINDHINLMGVNPLVGKNIEEHGKKFVDMSEPYSKKLISLVKQSSPIPLKEGVYIGVSGPSFETPAEVRFFRAIGGGAVGMSTVPETIVANHCKIDTLGLSCISNYASGLASGRLSHEEVISIAKRTENDLVSVILNAMALI
ncbi:MAG TPA: purine-nucleoside phosphorylase [Spirochaetota bacterium]|nr:purine-nucleoside phosphorylase [Spirochaetota bacterium]